MKAPYKKDKVNRQNFITYENQVSCLKTLKINSSLSLIWWARHKLDSFPNIVYKNRCLASNKGRSVKTDFKLSRHELKKWAQANKLPGLKQASW
jgi:ribosomal protein S14